MNPNTFIFIDKRVVLEENRAVLAINCVITGSKHKVGLALCILHM